MISQLRCSWDASANLQLDFNVYTGYGNVTVTGNIYGDVTVFATPVSGATPLGTGSVTAVLVNAGLFQSPQTATTSSIGGSPLTAGQCASGTATLANSATGHAGTAAPSDGTNVQTSGGGLYTTPQVTVDGTTATVEICDIVAGTPTAKAYNVTVF